MIKRTFKQVGGIAGCSSMQSTLSSFSASALTPPEEKKKRVRNRRKVVHRWITKIGGDITSRCGRVKGTPFDIRSQWRMRVEPEVTCAQCRRFLNGER